MTPPCQHLWITNSGQGGDPVFRPVAIVAGETPVMHVSCDRCGARTWFTRAQWAAIPREGENRGARRRRMREAEKIARRERQARARLMEKRRQEHARTGAVYWNGEPCEARRVVVQVGKAERETHWHHGLEGQERRAVEVTYHGQVFFLDDEDGSGWEKVTVGLGSPGWGHAQLPDGSVVVREVSP